MKISIRTCVLTALITTGAHAQGTVMSVDGPEDPTGPRIAVEIIGGGLGAVAGGGTAFMLGASTGDATVRWLSMIGGFTVGSWLGTSIGGSVLGGRGHWGVSLLGALGGGVASMGLKMALGGVGNSSPLVMVLTFVLPIAGGAIGYEVSQAFGSPRPPGPLKSAWPAISLASDGKSPLAGIAGTF